jgi:hypothetical protein
MKPSMTLNINKGCRFKIAWLEPNHVRRSTEKKGFFLSCLLPSRTAELWPIFPSSCIGEGRRSNHFQRLPLQFQGGLVVLTRLWPQENRISMRLMVLWQRLSAETVEISRYLYILRRSSVSLGIKLALKVSLIKQS